MDARCKVLKVIQIEARNPGPMTGTGNHTYLLVSDRTAVLVDAGVGAPAHLAEIAARLSEHHASLTDVLVTHGHGDHADGAAAVARAHPSARFWKYPWPEQDERFGVSWRRLDEGGRVPLGRDEAVEALHTPGHSPDHLAFWHAPSRSVFAGDLVVGGGSVMVQASRGGRLAEYLVSLERIRALEPRTLYPAHGPLVERPDEVLATHIAHRLERERQVLDAVAGGASNVRAIAERIYHDLSPALEAAARENVRAHLEKLRDEGRVREDGDQWTP
jgi:glyoxylase-like metal-dependent hydrolase (beta-lactamase superfamily II)